MFLPIHCILIAPPVDDGLVLVSLLVTLDGRLEYVTPFAMKDEPPPPPPAPEFVIALATFPPPPP